MHEAKPTKGRRLRARLRQAAFTRAPLWMTGGRLARSKWVQQIHMVRHEVKWAHLPTELEGVKITHLSDLHVGPILKARDLPKIVDLVNRAGGDMVAVTGDFVDLSLSVLDSVITALHQIHAPLGVWLVPGNHDYLEDGQGLLERFRAAKLGLLLNTTRTLKVRGVPVEVAGIDFAHQPEHLSRHLHHTYAGRNGASVHGLRLLLSHHPYAFDWAQHHAVDLTLSGHTHGGQVILRKTRGKRGSIGLGSMGFRYPHGLYRKDKHYLYVTTGVGSWFPFRHNCPAEIASLVLRRAA